MSGKKRTFWQRHGLSIVTSCVLLLWTLLYLWADPEKHWGAFFGNAIADWTGMLVMILATKYLHEVGSAESKSVKRPAFVPKSVHEFLHEHSLVIFIVMTGAVWITMFAKMQPSSKWGQVVGNIVSEWTQVLGVVVLTKGLVEVGSKESK
jgi:hypothetical protein